MGSVTIHGSLIHKLVAYYYLRIQILVIWKITKSVGIKIGK